MTKVNEDLNRFFEGQLRLNKIVKERFRYDSLRPGQAEIVDLIMQGEDVIGILPTGAGKTSCFVIPALAMEWPLLVFSPLQALMRDQCMNLCRDGIKAARMSGDQTDAENVEAARRWQLGEVEVLFVAPERMQNDQFLETMRRRPPVVVSVDECHTVAEWSDNFRPQYARVGDFISKHVSTIKSVAAFSATLPPVAEEEVRQVLNIPHAHKVKHYPRRDNLELSSEKRDSFPALVDVLRKIDGPTIVYCATRKNAEEVASRLSNHTDFYQQAVYYHGGMPDNLKRQNQDDFMADRVKVIAATNAFGMGVNKPNIRGIIHWDLPGSLEALVQEVGRGGRDGKKTICHAFYRPRSVSVQEFLLDKSNPTVANLKQVYHTLTMACGSSGNKTCKLSNTDIAGQAGMDSSQVSSCISRLVSAKVVDRYTKKDTVFTIKFPDVNDEDRRDLARMASSKFDAYEAAINKIGVSTTGGAIEFDMDPLCDILGVSETTIRGYFRTWQREDFITLHVPFKGSITKLIGDLSLVPMDKVKAKRQDSFDKLRDVQKYFEVADSEKHTYLEKYFNQL